MPSGSVSTSAVCVIPSITHENRASLAIPRHLLDLEHRFYRCCVPLDVAHGGYAYPRGRSHRGNTPGFCG